MEQKYETGSLAHAMEHLALIRKAYVAASDELSECQVAMAHAMNTHDECKAKMAALEELVANIIFRMAGGDVSAEWVKETVAKAHAQAVNSARRLSNRDGESK
jgi:hypothetical protein